MSSPPPGTRKVNGSDPPILPSDTSPWDGTWAPADPNQVGSGWDDDGSWDDRGVLAPVVNAVTAIDDADLAIHYDLVVDEILRRIAHAQAEDGPADSADTHSDYDNYDGEMLHAPTYMEYILTLRACTRSGCSRSTPCSDCRQHDGANLWTNLWHHLSDARIEAHLVQYLRVRGRLPPWQPSRPASSPAREVEVTGEAPDGASAARDAASPAEGVVQGTHNSPSAAVAPAASTTGSDDSGTPSDANLRRRLVAERVREFSALLETAARRNWGEETQYLWSSSRIALRWPRVGTPRPRAAGMADEDANDAAVDEDDDDDLPSLRDVSDSSPEPSERGDVPAASESGNNSA